MIKLAFTKDEHTADIESVRVGPDMILSKVPSSDSSNTVDIVSSDAPQLLFI